MPVGNIVFRIQNNLNQNATRSSYDASNAAWNNTPRSVVNAGASSANFQGSYNFDPPENASLTMAYTIPGEAVALTASVLVEEVDGTVRATPSGAAPGDHQVTFVVTGAAPDFQVLFTFN